MKKFLLLLLLVLFFNLPVNADDTMVKDKINSKGYQCSLQGFASAVAYGDADTVEDFLLFGFSPDVKLAKIPMPFYAVFNEKPKTLDVLLTKGANPNLTWGKVSLLTSSVELKNSELIKVLYAHNADLNKEVFGITPLNFAIIKKNKEIAKQLLSMGAKADKNSVKYAKKLKDNDFEQLIKNSYESVK